MIILKKYRKNLNMSKFKIVNLLDKIFVTIALFLIIFAWINFYLHSLWTSFVLSTLISIALIYVLYFFINRKQIRIANKKADEEVVNFNFLAFKLSIKDEKINLLNQIYSKTSKTSINNGVLYYKQENTIHQVIIATHMDKLDQHILLNILDSQATNADCYDIICEKVDLINLNIYANKKVEIINKEKLYKLFVNSNIYPNVNNLAKNISKAKFKDVVRQIFAPPKSKSYFFCGLILIFSSIILPYHYYYIVFGSMLLLFSIICKILPKFTN